MPTTTPRHSPSIPTALLRQAMQESGIPMAIRTVDLWPIYANKAFLDMYAARPEDLRHENLGRVLPPATRKLYRNTIQSVLQMGESWEGEYLIRLMDGSSRQIWARFDPLRDDTGEVAHILSIQIDASEKVELRERLVNSERYLRFLANSESDMLFRVSIPNGRREYISSAVSNITGYPPQSFYGERNALQKILPEEYQETLLSTWAEICRGDVRPRYQFPVLHRNGDLRWLECRASLVRNEEDIPVAVEGIATDITAQRKAEETLTKTMHRFRFLADNMADTLWSADAEGRLSYVSPAAEKILGMKGSSLIGKNLESLFDNDYRHAIRQWTRECANTDHRSHTVELPYDHPTLGKRWVSMHGTAVSEEGQDTQMLGLFRDVTRRRRALEKLYDSESRYRAIFEDSPISLWEEDLSELREYLTQLAAEGVTDFKEYLRTTPGALAACCRRVRVLDVNRATVELMNAPNKRHLLGPLDSVIPEEAYHIMADVFAQLAEGNSEYCGEVTNRTADGELKWVMVHFSAPKQYRKTLERVIVSLIDLTPRKRAEQALQESERRYKALVDNSGEGVLVTQEDRVLFANNAMTRTLGNKAAPELFEQVLSYVHPLDRDDLDRWLYNPAAGEHYPAVLRIFTGDGELHWLTLARRNMEWHGEPATMFIIADVSSHKILERELLLAHAEMEERVTARTAELNRVNEQLKAEVADHVATQILLDESRLSFKALLDASPDFICLLDDNINVLAANAISLERFGVDPLDLQQRHLPRLMHRQSGSALARMAQSVMQSGAAAQYTDSHEGRTYHNNLYPISSEDGEVQRMAFYSRDITEQIRAEERIRSLTSQVFSAQETERQRIARDLHDNVAQDLSSALVAIEALEASTDSQTPTLGGMQISEVLRRSVSAVRDIAYGLHPSGLEQLGLGPAVQRMCDDFSAIHEIEMNFSSLGIDRLQFDFEAATNIYRIIQEALNNAGKHAKASRMAVRLVAAHPELIIRIEDDGVGFNVPAKLKQAASDKRMGLRSIKERSRLLGGEATIHSVSGSGTKITVKLPTAACTR